MTKGRQRGFTLIEVMAAMAGTAIVIGAASAMLMRCLSMYDELSAKIAINRHAREVYEILSLGGKSSSTGNDGTKSVYGIRQRNQVPSGSSRNNYAFSYSSNNLTLSPDKVGSMSVTCTGVATPAPDCTGAGATKTVNGWIGNDIQASTSNRSVSGVTAEVAITVMNPYQIQRAKSPAVFTEIYRTVFVLNRHESDP